jgi:hypothetical protein
MSDQKPCVRPGCPALALSGVELCAVHLTYAQRPPDSAAVYCYACGRLIRIGQRWVVRAEGAFHARPSCLMAAPHTYLIPVRDSSAPAASA